MSPAEIPAKTLTPHASAVRQRHSLRALKLNALRLIFLVSFLAVWEVASGRIVPEFFLSRPTAIFARLYEWVMDGSLFFHAAITAAEALLGFLLGGTIGLAVGVLLGRSRFLGELLDPFIMVFYSLPKIALAPLFILWIGIGMTMKVVLTATIVFFLVFLNTYSGVRNVSPELVAIVKLMGAKERDILRKVVIPSALTWVFAGLRISVPYALIGAIVGELMASNRGLGAVLVAAQGQFDTAGVFAALIGITTLAYLLNTAVRFAERKSMPWVNTTQDAEIRI
ncbi:MAG TPA: ABC transporter permease [Burkholderiales bacterium]|nr:ABC transporter permease [Burkholderiales bacterium]